MIIEFSLPVQTVSEANSRGHWAKKARRAKAAREIAFWTARERLGRRRLEAGEIARVELTRLAPPRTRFLDDDNLASGLKAVRDGLAAALGVDDGARSPVVWTYGQGREPGRWGVDVRVVIEAIGEAAGGQA